jgi:large conductance mechanosensitive channel
LDGFKKFILRGSVVDLAVGIVIGAAFGVVVTSFVNDVLMQFVGAIFGKPSFNQLQFTINDSHIRYGNFLTAVITFIITAAALYFVVVAPLNHFNDRRKAKRGEPEELTNEERVIELLEQIAAKS